MFFLIISKPYRNIYTMQVTDFIRQQAVLNHELTIKNHMKINSKLSEYTLHGDYRNYILSIFSILEIFLTALIFFNSDFRVSDFFLLLI